MKLKKNNKSKEKVLIVVAHPDDEVLGCGGYISKYKNKKIFRIIFIAEGTSCRFSKEQIKTSFNKVKEDISKRQKQSIKAIKYLGVNSYRFYNLPCGRLDQIPIIDINKIIEKEIATFKPNILFTHNSEDCNNDHRILNRSVNMSTRPNKNNSFLNKIINFEILTSTEWNFENQFSPNYFEALSQKNLREKVKAFYFYSSEVQSKEMPRTKDGLETIARYRGKMVCKEYCEAFKIIRNTKN